MGFIGFCLKLSILSTALLAILIGFLVSGVDIGFFAYLDALEGSRGTTFFKGMLPAMHRGKKWGFTEDQMPDLSGQTFLITGANSGLGYWSAYHLAKANATVVVGCRNMNKCQNAADALNEATGSTSTVPLQLDLSSFASILSGATEFKKKFQDAGLDGLLLNAGIMIPPFAKTSDGIESQIGVNHFGHQLLTDELLPLVKQAAAVRGGATVVSVSSAGHFDSYPEGILPTIEAMNNATRHDPAKAYGQSKLANVLFAQELSERVRGSGVLVNSVHPGGVDTELFRHLYDKIRAAMGDTIANLIQDNLLPKGGGYAWAPRDAALTSVYASIASKVKVTGRYFHPIARETLPDLHARDKKLQKHLWQLTESFIADWRKANQ